MCIQYFTRPITTSDWTRFHNLAHRVRTGTFNDAPHSSIVTEIHATNTRSLPLLPSITKLEMDLDSKGHSLIFMTPTLHHLRLASLYTGDTLSLQRFLSQVSVLSPELRHLGLHLLNLTTDDTAVHEVARLCRSLKHVRSADVGIWGDITDVGPIATALAELPSIDHLEFGSRGQMDVQWDSITSIPFPHLRKLYFRQRNILGLPALLDAMAPSLIELEIGHEEYGSSGNLREMVAATGRHTALETFIVTSYEEDGLEVSSEILQPLHSCGALRELSINLINGQVQLDDDDIAGLIPHLPSLERLSLLGDRSEGRFPTLLALVAITTACPAINDISLEIDATGSIPEIDFEPLQLLSTLSVHDSEIDDPESVALFLSRLSNAEFSVHHGYFGVEYYWKRWEKVREDVAGLQRARMHGQRPIA